MKGGDVVTDAEKAAAAKNAYMREWRKKHPENVKRHQMRYWLKKAEAMQQVMPNA